MTRGAMETTGQRTYRQHVDDDFAASSSCRDRAGAEARMCDHGERAQRQRVEKNFCHVQW